MNVKIQQDATGYQNFIIPYFKLTFNNCTSDNLPQYYAKPEAACAVLGS
jgi:hypothetical protein